MQQKATGDHCWSASSLLAFIVTGIGLVALGGCGGGSQIQPSSLSGAVSVSSVSALLGDLDGDGRPGIGDAIGILRIVVGLDPDTPIADCDQDGFTGVNDAIMVLRCVVGLDSWPIGRLYPVPDRQISGTVVETDLVIGAGEAVEAVGDTVIQCQTATISGDLFSRATGAPGADGASITIDATGAITIVGNIETAAGGMGDSGAPDGGDGGSITLRSSTGSVVIGVAPGAAAISPLRAGAPSLKSGDGADGADGGAGGAGGAIRLEAPQGTVYVNQSPELFALGDGGDGGQLVVGGADLLSGSIPDQLTNAGGNGGSIEFAAQQIEGVALIDRGPLPGGMQAYEATFTDGVVIGGAGGDAGDFFYGEDPQTGASTWPSSLLGHTAGVRPLQARIVEGAPGGDGIHQAGNGQSISITDANTGPAGAAARTIEARGGRGGNCGGWVSDGVFIYIRGSGPFAAGNGGSVQVRAAHGNPGGAAGTGGAGGEAIGVGGHGGNVHVIAPGGAQTMPGRGGHALAYGGNGGRGSTTCTPPGPGGSGGSGGEAHATGGDAGVTAGAGGGLGVGGDARAVGGNGGSGGDGAPAGSGGAAGSATGTPGAGNPNGTASSQNGVPGSSGSICGNAIQKLYNAVSYSTLNPRRVTIRHAALEVAVVPTQSGGVELGGQQHPFQVTGTQSIAATEDFGILWGIHQFSSVYMYRNPSSGGDRAPDVILTTTGTQPGAWVTSLWYDQVNDRLYCTHGHAISVWNNASLAQANRPADRTVTITGVAQLTNICGDPGRDIMFAITDDQGIRYGLICIDGIGTAQGTIAPSRVIDAGNFGVGLTYSGVSDRLYVGRHDPVNPAGTARVLVIANAAAASGAVSPQVLRGPLSGLDGYLVGLQVVAADDALFVGCAGASLLAYPFASTITGDTPPQSTGQFAGNTFLVVPAG